MGKINVLENTVSSKIAAGEVVERPVSVVKELVENSIDAGSKNIAIEIEGGGKGLIKIIDDGEGIVREDIKVAFERHATSKIRVIDDIFNIITMGFRGEALASIAAVSHISVISKTRRETIGTKYEIIGGKDGGLKDTSSRNGCVIEVKDLFFNTPARLNFLNSNAQEASRITEFITRVAMGHPDISFRLTSDGKEILYTSGSNDIREAIAKVHGVNIAKQMIYVETAFDLGKISGFISPPQHSRGNRTGQTFFVNRRFIKDKGLAFTVERAYKTMLPGGRFPISVIFIDIDSSQIDVNVHPAKTEVKFQREKDVQKSLFNAIVNGLKSQSLIPKEEIGEVFCLGQRPMEKMPPENETFLKNAYFPQGNDNLLQSEKIESSKIPMPYMTVDHINNKALESRRIYEGQSETSKFADSHVSATISRSNEIKIKITKILGQLFNTYIVAEGEGQFYIVDQHAAHEKILYEQFSRRLSLVPATQELLTPYPLELSVQELSFIEEHKEDLNYMGFDFSLFGTDTVLIRSVPYYFSKIVDPASLRDVLDHLTDQEFASFDAKGRLVASMACHTAIKAGDALSQMEMMELLEKLNGLDNPYTCPHGRPVIISNTLYDLEKKFKRVM